MRNVYFLIQLGTNSINLKAIRDRIPEKRFNLPHRNLHYRLSNDKTKAIAQLDMTEAEIVFVSNKVWATYLGDYVNGQAEQKVYDYLKANKAEWEAEEEK